MSRIVGHDHEYGRQQGLPGCVCSHSRHPHLLRSTGGCGVSLAQHALLHRVPWQHLHLRCRLQTTAPTDIPGASTHPLTATGNKANT